MVEVSINGVRWERFKQIDTSANMKNIANHCRIIVSTAAPGASILSPEDLIQVYFDGIPVIKGRIDVISEDNGDDTHEITYEVRSVLADFVDSSCPDTLKNVNSTVININMLVTLALQGLGLTTVSVLGGVDAQVLTSDFKSAATGTNIVDFISGYAAQAGVYLHTDGSGNIQISSILARETLKTALIAGEGRLSNIENVSMKFDYTQRFNTYIVRSGSAKGEFVDNSMRKTRILETLAQTRMTARGCETLAKMQSNQGRYESFEYSCQIAGFSANGQLWKPGYLVQLTDQVRGVSGLYLIKECTYSASSSGEITTLKLTYNDAFGAQGELDKVNAAQGDPEKAYAVYVIKPGDELNKIATAQGIKGGWQAIHAVNPGIRNPNQIQVGQQIFLPKE